MSNPLYATPRLRTFMSFANKARDCYNKHEDAGHGFINEMEEKINQTASADEIDVLSQNGILSGPIHNNKNRYILVSA